MARHPRVAPEPGTPPPENAGEPENAVDSPAGNGADVPRSPVDVFDNLGSFRLRQSFDKVKTRRPLTSVGIRKPKTDEWFMCHSDFRYDGLLFKAREEMSDEWFLPTTEEAVRILEELSPTGLRNACIFWWITRKQNTLVWPVELADSDGRQNDWHASMYEMMSVHANGTWCRIAAGEGGYNPTVADENSKVLPTPEWPVVDHFGTVLRVAFKKGGRVIDLADHPLIRRLRG